MSKAVEEATKWIKAMIHRESRGPGDRINAMRRISNRYGVPYNLMWSCLYRPPKDLYVSMYEKLRNAYEAELNKGLNSLLHERRLTNAKSELGKRLVRTADFMAGADPEALADHEGADNDD